jgi:hypothetical protein
MTDGAVGHSLQVEIVQESAIGPLAGGTTDEALTHILQVRIVLVTRSPWAAVADAPIPVQ